MKVQKKTVHLILLAVSAFLMAVLIARLILMPFINLGNQFEVIPVEIADYDLNDLGVVDVNQDQYLDIFTTNHSAQQSLLIGDGSGQFVDVFVERGLSQDRIFPKLENSEQKPGMDSAGLYIYRQHNLLNIVAHNTEELGVMGGEITLSSPVTFKQQSLADVQLSEEQLTSGGTISKVQFSLYPNGHLKLQGIVEIPHRIKINDNVPLNAVHVGANGLNPESSAFELVWRDRHSMAWTDLNSDGQLDVFIGRGGIKGKMRELPEIFFDELFIGRDDTFEDQGEQVDLSKDHCPGRQSAWVDYDQDGLLDIYNACGRSASDAATYPHQLFQQNQDGKFVNTAEAANLDLPRNGEFLWFDADKDGDLDVLTTQDKELSIYNNQTGTFKVEVIGQMADSSTKKFTVVDYDLDGNLDIYLSGKSQNYLLVREGDRYTLKQPGQVGLPNYGLCANWVDYDNDGLTDLHVVPGGLYRQQPNHHFKRTKLLSENAEVLGVGSSPLLSWNRTKLRDVRCSWFDYDNDGFRDLILAEEQVPSFRERIVDKVTGRSRDIQWQTRLLKNAGYAAHWLEVELVGKDNNVQAIGAVVKLESSPAGSNTIQKQQLGGSEGSYFSQGHYRTYFGLGQDKIADALQINWPNGEVQTIRNISTDQLITLRQ